MVGLLVKLGYLFLIVVAGVTVWFIEEIQDNVLFVLALIAVVVGLVVVFTPKMFPYSTGAEKIE